VSYRFWREEVRPPKAHNQFHKPVRITVLHVTYLDSEAQLYSIERTDGRKFDWIRKQLGLSKLELARQLGISREVSTGASGTDRRDLLLWQSSGYGIKIARGDC
jgi:hypothetical protein